jgi:hypothetical protein
MEVMAKQYRQAVQALALVHALQQKSSKMPVTKKDMAWLQLIQKKASITLKNTHPILQAQAQIKMDMLQQEAEALQTLLKKIL